MALIITRSKGDWLFIGNNIKIKILETRAGSVVLDVFAPRNVEILRDDAKKLERGTKPRRNSYFFEKEQNKNGFKRFDY